MAAIIISSRTRVRTIDDDNDDVGLAPRRVAICPLTIDDDVERSIIDVKVFMLVACCTDVV